VRVLVTGGAGFIGSALVKRLVAAGHDVVVLDNSSRGSWNRLDGVSCVEVAGDVRDLEDVVTAMHRCDAIVHMACYQGTRQFYEHPRRVLDVAVQGMLNVLDACEVTRCRDLLLVSSSEVYQNPPAVPTPETVPLSVPDVLNPRYSYAGGKIISELLAVAHEREGVLDRVVIARPHNVYGPAAGYEHVIPELAVRARHLMGEYPDGPVPFPVQGTGEETRAFCHIDDCTDALALLLESADSGVWHVGTPEETTIARLVQLTGSHYGRELKLVPGALQKGSPARRCPDITKLRCLGYKPKIPLQHGLPAVLDWYAEHPQ
jgi:dTDP-glucose 4,6-dehydratase/UDP-glucose 4-epimerase